MAWIAREDRYDTGCSGGRSSRSGLSQHALPLPQLTPRQAREQPSATDAVRGVQARRGQPPAVEAVGAVRQIEIPTAGGPLLARVYTPAGRGPFPILVYFHGGGWVIANLNVYDPSARALTNAARFIVVSVAYRQAPENPFLPRRTTPTRPRNG